MFNQMQLHGSFLFIVDGEKAENPNRAGNHLIATFGSETDAMAYAAYNNQELDRISFERPWEASVIIDILRKAATMNSTDRWEVYLKPPSSEMVLPYQRPGNVAPPVMDHWGGPSIPRHEPAQWGRGPQPGVGPSPFDRPGTYSAPLNRQRTPPSYQYQDVGQPKYRMEQPGHTCQFCHRPYRAGLVVDDEILEKIKPVLDRYEEGSLCPTCIVAVIVEMGLGSAGQLRLVLDNHRL